jgi:hypothetical protein
MVRRVEDDTPVPLSIVIGSIQGWPEIAPAIRAAEAAAARVGAELLVLDGSGLPAPEPGTLGVRTTWHEHPGESVFQLRLRGYEHSRGPIVAITEDHCNAPPDWCERMLAAHAEFPDAAAIGGSVENGSDESVMDWASFLIVQAGVMAPIRSGPATRLSGAVNVSYKREALDGIRGFGGMGAMDVLHQQALLERGEQLVADDRIRIAHVQSLSFAGFTEIHYHAGRTMSGFRRETMGPIDWVRFVGAFVVPLARFGRIVAIGTRKGYTAQIVRGAPAIMWLLYAQAVGQFLGYARGAGDSANQLQ